MARSEGWSPIRFPDIPNDPEDVALVAWVRTMNSAGLAVVNAPRPARGTIYGATPGMLYPAAPWRHGRFYMADRLDESLANWEDLDAWPVEIVTREQTVQALADLFKDHGITEAALITEHFGDDPLWMIYESLKHHGWPWSESWATPDAAEILALQNKPKNSG